jgi:phosphoserine phosphatase
VVVQEWITSAKHPETGRLYTEMVYQPMVELLIYLRSNGFKTFIVSGGGSSSCVGGRSGSMESLRSR